MRGRGRPHDSRSGDRRYDSTVTESRGHAARYRRCFVHWSGALRHAPKKPIKRTTSKMMTKVLRKCECHIDCLLCCFAGGNRRQSASSDVRGCYTFASVTLGEL